MAEPNANLPVEDIIQVTSPVVSCDGNGHGTASGHPLIYLNIGDQGQITCPYCSRQFVLVDSPF